MYAQVFTGSDEMSVTLMVQQKTNKQKTPKHTVYVVKTEMANMIKCQPLWTLGGENMGIYCSTLFFLFLKTSQESHIQARMLWFT